MSKQNDLHISFRSPAAKTFAAMTFNPKNSQKGTRGLFWKKVYPAKVTGVSYKNLSDWSTAGLIDDSRDNDKNWRQFSLNDLVWIRIVSELREYGMSLDKIKYGKNLLKRHLGNQNQPWDCLGWAIMNVSQGIPMEILVYGDGWMEVGFAGECANMTSREIDGAFIDRLAQATEDNPSMQETSRLLKESADALLKHPIIKKERAYNPLSVLKISINQIIGNLNGTQSYIWTNKRQLSKKDIQIIEMLKSGQFTEINIILKDGGIDRIEKVRASSLDPAKILKLIQDLQFGQVMITKQDGYILSCKEIESHKF